MRALLNPVLILLILLSGSIGASSLTRGHEWGDDFASYIMQAQSILDGKTDEFVERNAFTIFESSFQIGPVAYPWGYPLLLTPAVLLKGVHALTLKVPGLFLFLGFLLCLYLWTKNRLPSTEGLLLVSIFAFNPILIKFLDQILSDIPLLFFISLGLLLVWDSKPEEPWWKQLVLGLVIFWAFFVRTTGIILFASYLAFQFINFLRDAKDRKWIVTNTALTSATMAGLWLVTSLMFPNEQGSYLEQLKGLTPAIFKSNVVIYFNLIGSFLGSGTAWTNLYYILVLFFFVGMWARHKLDLLLIMFFSLYFVAMLFWPERQGIRFIFPLLPIFVYFVFQGFRFVILQLPTRWQPIGNGLAISFWLIIVGTFLVSSGTRAYTNLRDNRSINGPFDPFSSDVYNYIRAETSPDSVLVFWKPRAMRLFTDRNTFMSTECERLPLGDYVVISKKAENSQIPPAEIGQCNLALSNMFENQRFIIYKLPE